MATLRRRWWLGGGAAAAVMAALIATPVVLLNTAAGTAWLLRHLPGLEVQAPAGAFFGDRLSIERLVWQGPPGRLEVQQLRIEGLTRIGWPRPAVWLALRADKVEAGRVQWQSTPSQAPAQPVTSLRLPVAIEAPLVVAELQIDQLAPVKGLQARLAVGADGGSRHVIDGLSLRWDRLQAGGRLAIGADAPFPVQAALQAGTAAEAALPWQARGTASGSLERLDVAATLRARDEAFGAELSAALTPLARWPLAALSARTRALDLSRLASGWPQTQLDGQAELRSSARDAPFEARLVLDNGRPGRWNEGRLPIRKAEATLNALLAEPDRIRIESLVLDLADSTGPAGRWSGQGEWKGHRLQLDSRVEGLVPQRLDSRAAAMRLGGALKLDLQGLPSPDPAAAAPIGPWSAAVEGRLEGRLDARPVPVQLQLVLNAKPDEIQLTTLAARSDGAEANASATLKRSGSTWAIASTGKLVQFDPAPWWPGDEGSAWRRGPHRLNGEWNLALTLPQSAGPAWQAIDGQGQLTIADSRLAGVALAGQARLQPGRQLAAEIDLGGNQLRASGQATADGRDDRWSIELRAPNLSALAPVAALDPMFAALPREGRAEADASLQGRWPALQGRGRAEGSALRAGAWALSRGTVAWQFGAAPEQSLSATVALVGFEAARQKVPLLDAELSGRWSAHKLRVDAALPVAPPTAVAQMLALNGGRNGTQLRLEAEGSLQPDGGRWRWAGQLQKLTAGAWGGQQPLPQPAPRDWLDAGPLRGEAEWAEDGVLRRLRVDAGRLALAGDINLAWDELRYDDGAWQAKATLEGFRAAPLLARWQPTMGWAGDLRLGATLEVRAGERFDADIVFERQGGDLQVQDVTGTAMALGLTDLRLGLAAHDGTWYFTQALAGRMLGEAGGALRVVTAPTHRWPPPDAPLDGSVQARVANLGVWGAWVPPGWRLEGALETKAQFAGRFGAPQLRGELIGSNLGVRNLFEGVHVSGGDVLVRLEGERATVERFRLAAGDGFLTVGGQAELGESPRARLLLEAERFQALGRVDRRLVASGRAELELRPDTLSLQGKLRVDEGLFDASRAGAPSLDDDVNVRGTDARAESEAAAAAAAEAPKPKRRIDVGLDVDLGNRLRVRGRGLDTLLAGQLRLSAPGGRLAVVGTVNTERGTYAAYAQKLEIERGLLAFSGPPDNPRLDVLALRPNLDIEVGVAITGTAQAPRVRLHSNPELSDTDKLSWLVLGRDPAGLGRNDTALLQRAAVALLAGEGEGPTDALIRNLGLDEVSLRQSDGDTRETIVTLGKQLSRRWYVGYERGVNATVGTWQLIYRIAQRFTLRAQSGGENSLDLIWVWRVP